MPRIVIDIKDGNASEQVNPNTNPNNPINQDEKTPIPQNAKRKDEQGNGKKARSMALALGMQIAQQSLSYVSSNIGKWSGDSRQQEMIDVASQALGIVTAFAIHPVVGTINLAFQATTSAIDYNFERQQEKMRSAYAKAVQGYAYDESIFSSRRH